MEIHITGQHIEITESLKNYVEEKFEKIAKMAPNMTHAHVVLKTDKMQRHLQSCAEANLHIPGTEIFASASSEDMYNAIVLLIKKLASQVQKYKETHYQ